MKKRNGFLLAVFGALLLLSACAMTQSKEAQNCAQSGCAKCACQKDQVGKCPCSVAKCDCEKGAKCECANCACKACKKKPTRSALSAEDLKAYYGVYEGILPGADNPGIKTTLTLNKDNTYSLRSEYIDRRDGVFTDKGVYRVEGDKVIIFVGAEKRYYTVQDDKVIMLDSEGNPITGVLAAKYELKKKQSF